jgi:hypothetical protein
MLLQVVGDLLACAYFLGVGDPSEKVQIKEKTGWARFLLCPDDFIGCLKVKNLCQPIGNKETHWAY